MTLRAGRNSSPALVTLALLLLLAARPSPAASRFLPGLAFRVMRTPHFRVYYHRGEERQARALGAIAESVRATLSTRLGLPAPEMTHVLLVDQDDSSNGWATPLPYDTVMVTAAWPAPSEIIGNTNDWLRLVFTHEYTHILHLQQSRGWARAVRAVFGRAPLAFPNLFLPQWETEGLATFAESRYGGAGRLAAGDSLTIVGERARESGPERLDQVTGGQVDWPAGLAPYLYGGFFAEYLAERFGQEKLGELARQTAGRLPYLASAAFRRTFGRGLGELWADYQHSLAASAVDGKACEPTTRVGEATRASCRRLTREGYYVSTPRFASDGRRIVYARRNADDFPALAVFDGEQPIGSRQAARKLATRYGGEQVSVRGRLVFFDQADYQVNVAWRSDLYAADLDTGRVQRLTRNARLAAPDISPDGRQLACIRTSGGERRLALFRVEGTEAGRLVLAEVAPPGVPAGGIYGSPRWSPDGTRLAAERRLPGGASEIVVIDVASGHARVAAASATGRNVTPAWLPDGRTLIFASDRVGRSFQLYSVVPETGEVSSVTSVAGGALAPDVSPDGRRLVYVGYTSAGYDLFEVPLQAGRADPAEPSAQPRLAPAASPFPHVGPDAPASRTEPPESSADSGYSPLFTLLPRSWQPAGALVDNQLRVGVSTAGADVLGRHAFGLTVLWRVQAGSSNAVNGPRRARPDWSAFYVYDRWRPAFFAAASDETTFLPQFLSGVRVGDAERRETHASLGVSVPFLSLRRGHIWQTALNLERNRVSTLRGDRDFLRNAIQTGWSLNSAHLFGYSISPEQGVSVGVTSEQVRSALGANGDADAFTGDVRGYLRLTHRHDVVAARVGLGVANGDTNVARVFYLGGPEPAGGLIDFGSSAFALLRGFEDKAFAASHVGVVNVEYRLPLWRIERGRGNWPLFLRTLHGAVFTDVGRVWDHRFSSASVKASVGAELSLDTLVGFGLPLTVSAGIARPFESGRPRGLAGYLRIGRAF
jgi:Tol biopolymer transport system component